MLRNIQNERKKIVLDEPNLSVQQQKLMKKAKILYMDAAFQVIRMPFHQLFAIHGFVNSNGGAKNYESVPRAIHAKINLDHVQEAVADFEKADVAFSMPNSRVFGCNLHFAQAVNRAFQSNGLATEYRNNADIPHF